MLGKDKQRGFLGGMKNFVVGDYTQRSFWSTQSFFGSKTPFINRKMDFLKAEIERKRKEKEEREAKILAEKRKREESEQRKEVAKKEGAPDHNDSHGNEVEQKKKVYVNRRDLEKLREQEYLQKMEEVSKSSAYCLECTS